MLSAPRERRLRVGARALDVSSPGPYQCAHPERDEALRLLVGLERQLDPLLRVPPRFVPPAREELGPAELGEYPGQRALLGTLLGLSRREPKSSRACANSSTQVRTTASVNVALTAV